MAATMEAVSCSSWDSYVDFLWSQIELAERYLVSNMFEDAANLTTTTLQKINTLSCDVKGIDNTHSSIPCAFEEFGDESQTCAPHLTDMIEAAGMVLIQAHSEMGRADELIKILVSHFGHVTNVPPSLYLTGISLQVSAGFLLSSRSNLEEYLEYWIQRQDSLNHRNRIHIADLAEVYAVHVLGRGCMDPEMAMKWVESTNSLTESKQAILDKLHALLPVKESSSSSKLTEHGPGSNDSSEIRKMGVHELGTTKSTITKGTENVNSDSMDIDQIQLSCEDHTSETPKLKVSRFYMLSSSFWLNLVKELLKRLLGQFSFWLSRLPAADQVALHGTHITGGFASIVLFYALIKQRHYIKRTLTICLKNVRTSLGDFWHLAFGLQISPLVASQAPVVSSQ